MTRKNFWKVFSGKAVLAAVLPLLCLAFAAPAFAQTAEIRSTGVYYIDGTENTPDINDVYCSWSADAIGEAGLGAYKSGIVNVDDMETDDPWQTSALIEYDQPYPSPNKINNYPNHCLALCMDVYCTNKPNGATTYSIAFPIQNIMFEIVKYRNGADIANPETNPAIRTIYQSILDNQIVDWSKISEAGKAIREAQAVYDSALASTQEGGEAYEAHSAAEQIWKNAETAWEAAVNAYNNNPSVQNCKSFIGHTTGGVERGCVTDTSCLSVSVATQSVSCASKCSLYDIFENQQAQCETYFNGVYSALQAFNSARAAYDTAKENWDAAESTFDEAEQEAISANSALESTKAKYESLLTVDGQLLSNYMCGAYSCMGATGNWETSCSCPNPQYECVLRGSLETDQTAGYCATASDNEYCCKNLNDTSTVFSNTSSICSRTSCKNSGENPLGETNCIVRAEGTGKGYNDPIRFCTSWDGSYEIQGEFGKTNGQFGFRATINTEYPGDGIAIENISINQTYPYPGNNQFPIQVDVTNVHTVRTTPTVVGDITGVQATPYSIAYRLSKDADVKIQIYDASAQVPWTDQEGGGDDPDMSNGTAELVLNQNSVVRTLADWEPRLGEGMQGSNEDSAVVESDPWDGRDDSGRLLPANNYLISVQAKSQDEWPGTDFSRAVTRQLSLDPLKLTDIQVQGLNKQSTAYAVVRYVPTEASNVYFEVYSPGTTFDSLYTQGNQPTGTSPVIADGSGTLVYSNSPAAPAIPTSGTACAIMPPAVPFRIRMAPSCLLPVPCLTGRQVRVRLTAVH